nr:RNA-directed DNA polymerase, eukaryota, reverse transcriptase zinc-binding domain protein [Tanacetum cinerariifolium]
AIEVPGWVPDFKEDGKEGYDVNDGSHEDDMYGSVSENLKDVKGKSHREEVHEINFEEVPNKKKVDNWSDKNRVNDGHKDGVCVGQHVQERVEVSNDTHDSTCSGHFKKSEVPQKIRIWTRLHKESLESRKSILKAELADLYGVINKGEGSDADGHRRREVVRLIQEVEKRDFVKKISLEHNDDLEREVSNEEIKKAVWDCAIDKAPGPDGFTFGFYRRYWDIVVDAVKWFFLHGEIPKGGNSSFNTLIPKVPNANMVKDFRPISLIGSLHKVIAKVLANRLVTVLDDIVDEIQSAFVTDRQILDGPFYFE